MLTNNFVPPDDKAFFEAINRLNNAIPEMFARDRRRIERLAETGDTLDAKDREIVQFFLSKAVAEMLGPRF